MANIILLNYAAKMSCYQSLVSIFALRPKVFFWPREERVSRLFFSSSQWCIQVVLLENWPPHSPDLNPQENVWPIAENILRAKEKDTDSFETFQKHCARAVEDYEKNDGAMLLVGSMATRLKRVVDMNGAMGSQ